MIFHVGTKFYMCIWRGAVGRGANLLTLRIWNYDKLGLDPNAITYYEMLLVTNEYQNCNNCIKMDLCTVDLITSLEVMPYHEIGLATNVIKYY